MNKILRRFKEKKSNITFIYFFITCVIAFVFLLSPLMAKSNVIRKILSMFLDGFQSVEYKIAYIETVGALLGTFLAITGALWTQSIVDENARREEMKKNALIVYYDLSFASEAILQMMRAIYPHIKMDLLPDDRRAIDIFRKEKRKHRIYISPNWRQIIGNLHSDITPREIRDIQIIYEKLSMICMSLNSEVSNTSQKEDMNAYSLMYSMITVSPQNQCAKHYFIYLDKSIKNLIELLASISDADKIQL